MLQFCPTHPTEKALMSRFGKLNIGAGKNLTSSAHSPEIQPGHRGRARRRLARARRDSQAGHDAAKSSSADVLGSRQALKNNYLYRMHGTVAGIWGNSKEEAIYPGWYTSTPPARRSMARKAATQFALPPGQLPPVNAFWSLTMYGMPSHLLVANPLNRYLINSPMLPDLQAGRRWRADASRAERLTRQGQGIELAARAERTVRARAAHVLAETGSAERRLEAAATGARN